MNFITGILDYFYNLFYGWDSLDITLLALAFYGVYRLGRSHVSHKHIKQAPRIGAVVIPGREYNLPPSLRDVQE